MKKKSDPSRKFLRRSATSAGIKGEKSRKRQTSLVFATEKRQRTLKGGKRKTQRETNGSRQRPKEGWVKFSDNEQKTKSGEGEGQWN